MSVVINMPDYRANLSSAKEKTAELEPVTITFFGAPYKTAESTDDTLIVNVTVQDGDYMTVINGVKEQGGIFLQPQTENEIVWFLPWP